MHEQRTLAYDDLPPGSDIRRAYHGAAVHITVPAGEPPAAALKQAAYEALASGATSSWALLLLSSIIFYFGIRTNRISGVSLTWAWLFFAIFCAALVALVSWIRYGVIADGIRAGRLQATIIVATSDRLLIETTGPFGTASYDLPRDTIARIATTFGLMRDDRYQHAFRVSHLTVTRKNGGSILLLPGRDPRELRWAASVCDL